MKVFKTCAFDKKSKEYVIIESEYPNKKSFIKDLRANGYRINDIRVTEKIIYDYIMEHTNATDKDFKTIKEII